ncbi:MAG: hypothetical protein RIT81_23145 [Deltaproteobacteria bacterium]
MSSGAQAAKKEHAWIAADVANLRRAPRANAEIELRLRINTHVFIAERKNGFARLRDPAPSGRTLWVAESVLAPTRTSHEDAVRRATEAKGNDAIRWWERATAIDPGRAAHLEKLAALYASNGRDVEAKVIRERLAGRSETFLAVCSGQRVLLAAKLLPDGTPVSMVTKDRATLRALASSLGAATWFGSWIGGLRPLVGTPFRAPKVVPVAEIDEDGDQVLELGPCADDSRAASRVYTTTPFERLDTTRGLMTERGAPFPFGALIPHDHVAEGWHAVGAVVRRIGDTKHFDVRTNLERAPNDRTAFRAITNEKGEPLATTGAPEPVAVDNSRAYRTWLRPLWRTKDRVIGVTTEHVMLEERFDVPAPESGSATSSVFIDVIEESAVRRLHVVIQEAGC